jgi:hypothetical protein
MVMVIAMVMVVDIGRVFSSVCFCGMGLLAYLQIDMMALVGGFMRVWTKGVWKSLLLLWMRWYCTSGNGEGCETKGKGSKLAFGEMGWDGMGCALFLLSSCLVA